jgi:glycosyl transferase family 25
MSAEAAKRNLPLERIAGVDGSRPEIAAAAAAVPMGRYGQMSTGAYGCFLSHRAAWRAILDSGDPWGLVLEDDLLMSESFPFADAPRWFPAGADIVKAETALVRCHVGKASLPGPGGTVLRRLMSTHVAAGCYYVSARAAADLLARTEQFCDGVDHILFDWAFEGVPEAEIWQVDVAPAVQGSLWRQFDSTPEWAQRTIEQHFVDEPPPESWAEPPTRRVARRVREEMRALSMGSLYRLVPFG